MSIKPMERIWKSQWPDFWEDTFEYGRESLVWHLYHNAFRFRDKTFMVFYGTEFTWKEFKDLVWKAAGGLKKLGINKGDRVYLGLQNCPQFIICYYAIMAVGGITIAGSPMYKGGELTHVLNDSGAKVVIMEDGLLPILQSVRDKVPLVERVVATSLSDYLPENPTLPVPPGMVAEGVDLGDAMLWQEFIESEPIEKMVELDIKNDVALLQYTSGTTGNPKGAMITHLNIMANAISSPNLGNLTADCRWLAVLPLFHVTGMVNTMNACVYLGGSMVVLTRFDAETCLMAFDRYKVTAWNGITTMNIAVINHPKLMDYDISSVSWVTSGGAPVPPAVVEKYNELINCNLVEGYGMSETISCTILNPPQKVKLGSIGVPIGSVQIRVADLTDESKDVPLGEEGELWQQAPCVGIGYWNNPEGTAETFLEDGWMKTGDIVKMDEEGYIYICGRTKEMIKSSGYSVFPAEVEQYLYNHPAISECCVIGVPHDYRGEDIKAFVILKPEWQGKITEKELIEWAREQMSVYKYPRTIEFRDELPKSGTGKIMRKILKAEEAEKGAAQG
ncbi:MAG: AMP-binding protein [Syntrophomonadales bacterium]|jgi:acyl-CoA synthetase (AMP-forming)/AMP-acid ligase II